jgi:hypothetical protein
MLPTRLINLKAKLKAAKAELKIRARQRNEVIRSHERLTKTVIELEKKIVVAKPKRSIAEQD